MRRALTALLLGWTVTVTGSAYDAARDEWVVDYRIADEAGAAVASGSLQMPASATRGEMQMRLGVIARALRDRRPPLAPGDTVEVP